MKQSVFEYETSCGEECTLEYYLAHVALLTNTDAEGRKRDGYRNEPSRFIFNVDKNLMAYPHELEASLVSETNWNISHSERMLESTTSELAFKPGDRIVHSIMGAGDCGLKITLKLHR